MNEALLHHLWTLKDWTRLEAKSREFLFDNPEDAYAQLAFSISLIKLNRLNEAAVAIRILAQYQGADSKSFHIASASYWLERNRLDYAWYHGHELIKMDPTDSASWQKAAGILLAMNYPAEAYGAILRARSLDPHCSLSAEIESTICAANAKTTDDLVRLQQTLAGALAVAPNSARIHSLSGDLKQIAKADHKGAMAQYRNALANNPMDTNCQRKLIELIPLSNLFVWPLFLPVLSVKWWFNVYADNPARLIVVLILAIKAVAIYLIWLIPALAIFLIPSVCYEYFFVADVAILAIRRRPIRWMMIHLQKIRFSARVVGFLTIWFCLISILFWWLGGIKPLITLSLVAAFYLFNLILIVIWIGIKRIDWWISNQGILLSTRSLVLRIFVIWLLSSLLFFGVIIAVSIASPDDLEGFNAVVLLFASGLLVFVNVLAILKLLDIFRSSRFDKKVQNLRLPRPRKVAPIP